MLEAAGYVLPTEAETDYSTVSKEGWGEGGAGLGLVEIVQLDPGGDTVETWTLKNTWIKSCKPTALDYDSDDLLNVELTLRYDFFTLAQGS